MTKQTDLLIIGAGPFGLSIAAYCKYHRVDHLVAGKPMDFWKAHMPKGMLLRSACDWHLDPLEIHTIESYLQSTNRKPKDVEPLSLDFYLEYVNWFREQKGIEPQDAFVQRLAYSNSGEDRLVATLNSDDVVEAKNVVLAIGFSYFKNMPAEFTTMFPRQRCSHTCDCVELEKLKGKRCLIIGGRQSAFEWAALLHEAGAAEIHVCHRHNTPSFTESDWSWVQEMVDRMVTEPGWFRNLSPEQKRAVGQRFWAEGRLKLEPWLWPRIAHDKVKIWPNSQVVACDERASGALQVKLNVREEIAVDHVVLATGYKVNMQDVPFLAQGNLLPRLQIKDGFPVLDRHFQSSVPGLFITSMAATQDFGAFLAFTVSSKAAALIIGSEIRQRLAVQSR